MSKTFTYTKITQQAYLERTDEWEEFGEEFEYTVDDSELLDVVADFVCNEYFDLVKKKAKENGTHTDLLLGIMRFIGDHDLLDELVHEYEEELKDYFEDKAMDSYEV